MKTWQIRRFEKKKSKGRMEWRKLGILDRWLAELTANEE
jgi:hypothetical protein